MRVLLAACFLTAVAVATSVPAGVLKLGLGQDAAAEEAWVSWMAEHDISYATADEAAMRYAIFAANRARVEEHNARTDVSWSMRLYPWSDRTWEEFKEMKGLLNEEQHCSATAGPRLAPGSAPRAPRGKMMVDWRQEGVVTHVKDQGHCGSCWTFSTTGTLESHWALATGDLLLLSEQQLVDCADGFDNNGCRGGLPSHAFEYIAWAGGIQNERTYKYRARESETCHFDQDKVVARVSASFNITAGDEDQLISQLTEVGPIAIGYAVVESFMHYSHGVYDPEEGDCPQDAMSVNHAVTVVGYGHCDKEDKDFYEVKNSWSRHWGMDGYFRISAHKNTCGLAMCASYPLLDTE